MSLPTPQWQLRQVANTLERLASELVEQRYADAVQSHVDGLRQLAEEITPAMRPDMLTPAQARVLTFIQKRITQIGEAPTRKEICQAFDFASPNAAQAHLKALERKGAITLTGSAARSIRLNPKFPSASKRALSSNQGKQQ